MTRASSEAGRVDAAQHDLLAQRTDSLQISCDDVLHRGHAGQSDDCGTQGAQPLKEAAVVESLARRVDYSDPPAGLFQRGGHLQHPQWW